MAKVNITKDADGIEVASVKLNLSCNMNDPDALEINLLELAHSLQMNDDKGFKGIGRCMKPLFSGMCEALRVHNATGENNAIFLNAILNFAVMATSMSISGCTKPSKQEEAVTQAIEAFTHGLRSSIEKTTAMKDSPTAAAKKDIDRLLAKFMRGKSIEC